MHRRLGTQMVIVVEDDNQLLLDAFENLIQQHINSPLWLLSQFVRLLQISEQRVAKTGYLLLDSVCQISQKHRRIGIGMIQLVPDVRLFLFAQKVGNQRGLSRTGVSCNERYRKGEVRMQTLNEPGTGKHFRRRTWRQQ